MLPAVLHHNCSRQAYNDGVDHTRFTEEDADRALREWVYLNEIALIFLQHYIKNSNAGPNSEWKLMLMDNHGSHNSHNTPEFITSANENHILPYPLLPHLTHCMQPLDVGIFGVYKHWHDKALQEAVAKGDLEYGVRSF